jgi:hypothetical protein
MEAKPRHGCGAEVGQKANNPQSQIMKIKKPRLANIEVASNPRLQNRKILGIARIFALATTVLALPAHELLAFTVNETRVLPFPTEIESTIPLNGDVNPYGVAFVPENFPAIGKLQPGDLLVSNFNDANNIQGTGTTIIDVSADGSTSLFFQGAAPLGLSTGLAVLKSGFVLVANCPTNNQVPVAGAAPGSLLLIGANGNLVNTFTSNEIQGPWDFSVYDQGSTVWVFVSNAINGTVSRIELVLTNNNFAIKSATTIASGYTHHADPATFEVAPTGSAFDSQTGILYVASTGDNAVYAVPNALNLHSSKGTGTVIYADKAHLHGALAMVFGPNGDLLVSNSDEFNVDPNQPSEIVEFTVKGQFVGEISVDPNLGGAFGLKATRAIDNVYRFAAVDDNANHITIWTLNTGN